MSSINPVNELATYLRGQIGALRGSASVAPARTPQTAVSRKGGKEDRSRALSTELDSARAAEEDLATSIARRVAAIDQADPERRRKAFRVFLESVLLDEWGPQLINDPGFYQLVESVQVQMETDPVLQALMDEAADRLVRRLGR
ncbi:MAG TPA: hypothetical protein VFY73_01400 [Ideonella sp.]|uniref:hypothetical protein n=1 Tax=Ideonella sp. TaxID=1929293 RepID=UPI002E309611|nr:hypothetical protein [Ideonella sp.]HEX5682663.1 hypothetical protein [Ideonella sp.]